MSYTGKNLPTTLLWGVGVVAAAIAVWQFYLFVVFRDSRGILDTQGGGANLWLAIGAAAVTCACVFLGIFRRINKTEEFHITS
ncbi:MAG TPA: hypothetical protein VER08_09090 [Pyrinomonadaceae bacterium]|nr:hypothetical protein [Pyrinomonadaceae bacterium]